MGIDFSKYDEEDVTEYEPEYTEAEKRGIRRLVDAHATIEPKPVRPERIQVGYVCDKGGGHFSLVGMSDHGSCGSHQGAFIYMELNPDAMRAPLDLKEQLESMARWVSAAEAAYEKAMWDAEEQK